MQENRQTTKWHARVFQTYWMSNLSLEYNAGFEPSNI